jgi:4-amino-4-deoxy-L-arabinose transferase-like glycosyltransferase
MRKEKFKKELALLGLIVLIGAFFRLFNLDWGEGWFFHPDENNIGRSISQLEWPQLHPHFFAYGHFSIYLAYFLNQFSNLFKNQPFLAPISFSQAIYSLRFLSGLESVLLIFLVFAIGKRLFNPNFGLVAAALVSLTPGLIQAAHFGTTEPLLTLTLFSSLYFSYKLMGKKPTKKTFLFLGIILGIGLSTKINALIFFVFPFLALFLKPKTSLRGIWAKRKLFLSLSGSFLLAIIVFFLTSPYQILDWGEFSRIIRYEIGIAQGKNLVFYTRQFLKTKPAVFQLGQILPFSLNPILEISGLIGFFLIPFSLIRRKINNQRQRGKILTWLACLIYLPSSLLTFTKWARFTLPLLPFFSLFSLEVLEFFKKSNRQFIFLFLRTLLISAGFLASIAFFSIYARPDIRTTASNWLVENLPSQSLILNEQGNVINLPLKGSFRVTNFDFYNLDDNPDLFEELLDGLEKNDYLLIPSRRIFANHPIDLFPKTGCYFRLLFSGKLGFKEIKKFTAYPRLFNWEFPDEMAEETWSVFDHPVIRIYQKKASYSEEKYRRLFNLCLNSYV